MGNLIPIYQFVNSGNTISNFGVAFDDILVVKREGIGYKLEQLPAVTYTQEATAYTFLWAATKPNTFIAGLWFVKTSSLVSITGNRFEVFELGPTILEGYRYTIQIDTVTVGWTALAGDTPTGILTALMNAINAATYPTTVTAVIISGPRLRIEFDDPAYTATPGYHYFDYYLYKSGRFVTWGGDYYLISEAESNNSLPAIPAASAPYDWSELTFLPGGIGAHLSESGYTVQGYFPQSEGSVNIENVPVDDEAAILAGDTAYYGNELLTFANNFSTEGETVLILHKA